MFNASDLTNGIRIVYEKRFAKIRRCVPATLSDPTERVTFRHFRLGRVYANRKTVRRV